MSNTTPDNALPENATPENAKPENATPENAKPENAKPDNATPDNAMPDKAMPDNAKPDSAIPDKAVPDNAIPNNAIPNNVPQNIVPASDALKPSRPTKPAPARHSHHPKDIFSDLPVPKEVIIGAAVGIGVFLLASFICCIVCCCRKKRKKSKYNQNTKYNQNPYHMNPNFKGGDQYYSSSQQPLNSQSGGHPSGNGWQGQQPPYMMTGSDTSSNYSGSRHPSMPPPSPGLSLGFNKSTFTYDELAAATGGFSQANLLGQGGFGYVHKGTLPDGKVVAVKSLKLGSGQGEREFQAEVEIISRVHHRHLVSLVGYCIAGGQRMLVYQFVPNNTLEHHLFGKNVPPMSWLCRHHIALGSAKGLAYLHEDCHPRIIHRDIKTANILLDENFEAMVADFGLAKLSSDNNTHVSTRIMGTFGYLAPEYASSGKLTEKSDVYSYGVMLLELITGKKPIDHTIPDGDSLVDWARPLLTSAIDEGRFGELADPRMGDNYDRREMTRMATCAAASIRHSSKKRPKMSKIVHALQGDVSLDDLNEGTAPGQSTMFNKASLEQHRKLALGSVEFSDEFEHEQK